MYVFTPLFWHILRDIIIFAVLIYVGTELFKWSTKKILAVYWKDDKWLSTFLKWAPIILAFVLAITIHYEELGPAAPIMGAITSGLVKGLFYFSKRIVLAKINEYSKENRL